MFLINKRINATSTHEKYSTDISLLKRRIKEALEDKIVFNADNSFGYSQTDIIPIINHSYRGDKMLSFVINNNMFILECRNGDNCTIIFKMTSYKKMIELAKVTERPVVLESTSLPYSEIKGGMPKLYKINSLALYDVFATTGEEGIIFKGSGVNIHNSSDVSEFVLIYSYAFGFIFIPRNLIQKHDYGMKFVVIEDSGMVCICCKSGGFVINVDLVGGNNDDFVYNETVSLFDMYTGQHIHDIQLPTNSKNIFNELFLTNVLNKKLLVTKYNKYNGIVKDIEMIWINIQALTIDDIVTINTKLPNLNFFRFVRSKDKSIKILINKLIKYQTIDGLNIPIELLSRKIVGQNINIRGELMSFRLNAYI